LTLLTAGLIKSFDKILEPFKNLADNMDESFYVLAAAISPFSVSIGLFVGAVHVIKNAGDIFKDATNLFNSAADKIEKAFNALGDSLGSIGRMGGVTGGGSFANILKDQLITGGLGTSVGIGGGVIGKIGGAFGFQDGFDVPNNPRFAGDNFGPVNLDAGESVITRKTTDRLSTFLDRVEGGGNINQPVNVTIQVGEKELADTLVNLNLRGFRIA
jgi:hypothetical protein